MAKPDDNRHLILYVGTHHLLGLLTEIDGRGGRILRSAEMCNPEGFQRGGVAQLEKAAFSIEKKSAVRVWVVRILRRSPL